MAESSDGDGMSTSILGLIEGAKSDSVCPCCDGAGRIDLRPLARRAAARTTVTESGCWEYDSQRPYTQLVQRALRIAIHAIGYRLWKGEPKESILHTCDNGRCWNPDHLYDGDADRNNKDRRERYPTYGATGERSRFAKLTREQVAIIRASTEEGNVMRLAMARELAERFGVTYFTIYRIVRGDTWRDDTRVKPEARPHWAKRGVSPRQPRKKPQGAA